MKKNQIIALLILLVTVACKKDDEVVTVKEDTNSPHEGSQSITRCKLNSLTDIRYNASGQNIKTTTFTYDSDDRINQQTTAGSITYYFYEGDVIIASDLNSSTPDTASQYKKTECVVDEKNNLKSLVISSQQRNVVTGALIKNVKTYDFVYNSNGFMTKSSSVETQSLEGLSTSYKIENTTEFEYTDNLRTKETFSSIQSNYTMLGSLDYTNTHHIERMYEYSNKNAVELNYLPYNSGYKNDKELVKYTEVNEVNDGRGNTRNYTNIFNISTEVNEEGIITKKTTIRNNDSTNKIETIYDIENCTTIN